MTPDDLWTDPFYQQDPPTNIYREQQAADIQVTLCFYEEVCSHQHLPQPFIASARKCPCFTCEQRSRCTEYCGEYRVYLGKAG